MKIYTRSGDGGQTGLFGAGRVPKDHPRVRAMGEVDELNAAIGWAITQLDVPKTRERLASLQHELFAIGAEIATPPAEAGRTRPQTPDIGQDSIARHERWIDETSAELPELRAFVLPGGTPGAAALHAARTVCRRAERAVVALAGTDGCREEVVAYLNRLSDLLFVFARLENQRAGLGDVVWEKR
ncbi:MAG: cob(I)yrinic acid a,c-diamide adenosyltransferase [Gemmatimonadales bacterium]